MEIPSVFAFDESKIGPASAFAFSYGGQDGGQARH
jgi:hypothetical protein